MKLDARKLHVDLAILDFDDTLAPTEHATFILENEILMSMGLPPMERETHRVTWGRPIEEAIALRAPGIAVNDFLDQWHTMLPKYAKEKRVDVIPSANFDALDILIERGIKIAVLTSRTSAEMKHIVEENHPLAKRVQRFYTKGQYSKPDPKVFDAPFSDFSVSPERTVYVGDNIQDAMAATGAGAHFIACLESGLTPEALFPPTVNRFISKFYELPTVLDRQSFKIFNNESVPSEILEAAKDFLKFLPKRDTFQHYVSFSSEELTPINPKVHLHFNKGEFPDIFPAVANEPTPARAKRTLYLEELLRVYRRMEPYVNLDPETLLIAPQREGALLTGALGWDQGIKTAIFPHAKRIHHKDGLVVGLTGMEFTGSPTRAVIVDGAIASGATLLAMIALLAEQNIKHVKVYAVHSTECGLQTILHFAQKKEIDILVHVGFVSGVLNNHYYATSEEDRKSLVMGDLGDTIADLF